MLKVLPGAAFTQPESLLLMLDFFDRHPHPDAH